MCCVILIHMLTIMYLLAGVPGVARVINQSQKTLQPHSTQAFHISTQAFHHIHCEIHSPLASSSPPPLCPLSRLPFLLLPPHLPFLIAPLLLPLPPPSLTYPPHFPSPLPALARNSTPPHFQNPVSPSPLPPSHSHCSPPPPLLPVHPPLDYYTHLQLHLKEKKLPAPQ